MNHSRTNAYRVMWLFVFFDLPVTTQRERKRAAAFRNNLLKDGFGMMQFSVYTRHCASKESMKVHIKRVKRMIPPSGHVSILSVTDKQYGTMLNYWGLHSKPLTKAPPQLELF